mgnify:CR=1 FL=1
MTYSYLKKILSPTRVAVTYLGTADRVRGDNLIYYSPLRDKERTPSFFVNDEKGIHDFGTGKHYDIISFVAELYRIKPKEALQKIVRDFKLEGRYKKCNIE